MGKHRKKLLIFTGPSGTGKSYIENYLHCNLGSMFYKLPQVTTRAARPGETQGVPYIFVDDDYYESIKHLLIGTNGVAINEIVSIFSDKYGTLNCMQYNIINTAILSYEGIMDILNNKDIVASTDIFILGLNNNIAVKREGRDASFIEEERKTLELCDYVWSNPDFITPQDVMTAISTKPSMVDHLDLSIIDLSLH